MAASAQLSTPYRTKSQLVAPTTLHINEATAQPSYPDYLSAWRRDSNSEPRDCVGGGTEGKSVHLFFYGGILLDIPLKINVRLIHVLHVVTCVP